MPLMKPTRDGYGDGLLELGAKNKDVVALSADLTGSTRASWFRDKYPDRFFEMGVAEQDMFSTAAGLALSGKIPFCSTFGCFASGRAWDQLRVSVCYMNLNVKVGASHGGISVGEDGATHQALEDVSLMRALPNMTVVVPCDYLEAKKATIQAAALRGPVYLRFGRENAPIITKEEDVFKIGKAVKLREGKDVTIIACGIMVNAALEAAELLKKENISAEVINMHTIKPIDKDAILESAKKTKAVVTAEEHTIMGGLGSAVSEVLSQNFPVPLRMVGTKDKFGESGKPSELLKAFGLTFEDIAKKAREVIELKKS